MLKVGENNFLLGSFRGRGSHKNAGDSGGYEKAGRKKTTK